MNNIIEISYLIYAPKGWITLPRYLVYLFRASLRYILVESNGKYLPFTITCVRANLKEWHTKRRQPTN